MEHGWKLTIYRWFTYSNSVFYSAVSLPEDISKPFNFRLLSLSHRQLVSFQKGLRGHTVLPSGGHRPRKIFRKRLHLPPNILTSGKLSQSSKWLGCFAAKTRTFSYWSHTFLSKGKMWFLVSSHVKTDTRSHPPTKETHHSMVPNIWFQLASIGFSWFQLVSVGFIIFHRL